MKYCNDLCLKEYWKEFLFRRTITFAMFGIENRTTKDMDTTIAGIDISKSKMVNILKTMK